MNLKDKLDAKISDKKGAHGNNNTCNINDVIRLDLKPIPKKIVEESRCRAYSYAI